jgi:hypothetical protein
VQPCFIYAHCLHLHAIMHIISLAAPQQKMYSAAAAQRKKICAFQFTMWWREKSFQINIFSSQGKKWRKSARRMQNVRVAFYHFYAINHLKKASGEENLMLLQVCGLGAEVEPCQPRRHGCRSLPVCARGQRISWADSASARAQL